MVPIVLGAAAFSGLQWLWPSREVDDKDRGRLRHALGWLAPEMEPHWRRLEAGEESWFHCAKNVASEWCRLDPQRCVKLQAVLVAVLLMVAVAW